jgi:hypothetical protein
MPFFVMTETAPRGGAPEAKYHLGGGGQLLAHGGGHATYAAAQSWANSRVGEDEYWISEAPHRSIALLQASGIDFPTPRGGWARYTPFFDLVDDLGRRGYGLPSTAGLKPWTSIVSAALLCNEGRSFRRPAEGYDPTPALRSVLEDISQDAGIAGSELGDRVESLMGLLDVSSAAV